MFLERSSFIYLFIYFFQFDFESTTATPCGPTRTNAFAISGDS